MDKPIGVIIFNIFLLIVEFTQLFLKSLWFTLQSIYYAIVPPNRKCVFGETVLVTGAAHGLGRELALRFARLGATVVLWDVNQVGCDSVVKEIRALNGKAYAYHCDVSNEKCVEENSEKVKRDVGNINILVNNAGMVHCKELLRLSCQQIRRTMEVNTLSHFWTIREFLPDMLRNEHGHIVAIASLAGLIGSINLTDYCASKFAILGLMSSLGEELHNKQKDSILLTTVCPAVINTGFAPLPPIRFSSVLPVLKLEQVADVIMDGILRNRRLVVIPSWVDIFTRIMRLLPWKVIQLCGETLNYRLEPNHPPVANMTKRKRYIHVKHEQPPGIS